MRLAIEFHKWDSQIGDVEALGRYALVLRRGAWNDLAATSEQLACELTEMEKELVERPDLWPRLGLPKPFRAAFARDRPSIDGPRVVRFDFHYTDDGPVLSEVNADVPGGFIEASALPALVADAICGARPAGDPAAQLADAMLTRCANGHVGLMVAPGHLEDMQVVTYLAARIRARGARASIGHARAFSERNGEVFVAGERVDLVYRFYQAEWLAELDAFSTTKWLFLRGLVPVVNPGVAALSESKRLPLVWRDLRASTATFASVMPESRAVENAKWKKDPDAWVVKGTYSNTGDDVVFPERLSRVGRAALAARALLQPERFVAQRRFATAPVRTSLGDAKPCVGVYTIDGKVAGAYARVATSHVVDGAAIDVACLVGP